MPLSFPEPPDPRRVTDWWSRFWSKPTTSGFPDPISGPVQDPYDITTNPKWQGFHGPGPGGQALDPVTLTNVSDLMGGSGINPDDAKNTAFHDILTADGYQAIAWDSYLEPVSLHEYHNTRSTEYLEREGFYNGQGYSYDFDWTQGGRSRDQMPGYEVERMSTVSKDPADLTYVPTSTTNLKRPRTVAAGWDGRRKLLTVMFRDGTLYNYYEVAGTTWANFVRARSKGRFIIAYLNDHIRGYASTHQIPQAHIEALYKVARTSQTMRKGYTGIQKEGSRRGGYGAYGKGGTARSGGRSFLKTKTGQAYTSAREATTARRLAVKTGISQSEWYGKGYSR